jgi:hypothetical protein
MTQYWGEDKKTWGKAKSVEQLTETSWAGVVSCGGDKEKLRKYHKQCDEMKQKILDVMKKENLPMTIEKYNEVRKRLFFS